MADKELDQLRQERLAQMESQYVSLASNSSPFPRYFSLIIFKTISFIQGNKNSEQQNAMQERARQQQEDTKNSILTQIMDQNARARCKYAAYRRIFIALGSKEWHHKTY